MLPGGPVMAALAAWVYGLGFEPLIWLVDACAWVWGEPMGFCRRAMWLSQTHPEPMEFPPEQDDGADSTIQRMDG